MVPTTEPTLSAATNIELFLELAHRLDVRLDENKIAELSTPDGRVPDPAPQGDSSEEKPDHAGNERVVRTATSGDRVYLLNETDKTRQWVTNTEILAQRGFALNDVTEITDDELMKYQQKQALYNAGS